MASAGGELVLIRDLALVLVTAATTALVFHKLRLPLVLGYLAAGLLVGPYLSPVPLITDSANIALLAQLGVLFLLFALGLDFHLGKLRRVGGLALTAGTLEVALMIGVGFLVGSLFGWSRVDAVFLGAMLAISSTTIIVKVLADQGARLGNAATQAIFGILLVEDVVAVLLIALLSSLAITGAVSLATLAGLGIRVAIFILAALVMGIVIVPRAVDHVAKLRVEEILVLFAVGIAFATSMIALALGLSIALGAFIAGAIIAESRASATVERRIAPLRDIFAAVFFVSTGILLNPADVIAYWPAILILATVTIVGKLAAVSFATFVAGYPPREAMRVGLGMAMIGEFSFVIAAIGAEGGVTSGFLLPIAVAVSASTALVTPPLIRNADPIITWVGKRLPRQLSDYAHMYHAWVGRAKRKDDVEAFHGRVDTGALLRVVSYGAVLVASGFVARYANAYVQAGWGARVDPSLLAAGVFSAWLLFAIPIVLGLLGGVRDFIDRLVFVVVPPRVTAGARGRAAASVFRNTLYAFLSVLFALVGLAAGAAFLPPLPLVIGALAIVGVAAFALRGSLRRLNQQLEQAVDVVFQAEAAPPGQRDNVLTLIRERYPWDMHVQSVIVPDRSRAANRRIRDLQLPQKTGASIVTHERDGVQTVNPHPDTVIAPGDVIGVLGERQQVGDALRLLTSESPADARPVTTAHQAIRVEEIDVREGSPLAGHTLAASRIRESTGASIVGLRREGVPILNPAPVLRLQPGDVVVVLGSAAQVDAARSMLAPRG